MAKRRMAVIALLLCFCMFLMPTCAIAASTADAKIPIDVNRQCEITLSLVNGQTAFKDVTVNLYKVADFSTDFQFTLTEEFKMTELNLNGVTSNFEWQIMRSTMEAYVIIGEIPPCATAQTDSDGKVCFENLDVGLYMAVVGCITKDDLTCYFETALISLPDLDGAANWQYNVSVAQKSEIIPPVEGDEEVEFKVVKLWKGDDKLKTRPKSVQVEIFKNGTSYKKVALSSENNWSYTWSAKNDGANWIAIERNVPKEYVMTVTDRDNTFIITNTYTAAKPTEPPKTGDTSNVMLYVVVMILSGFMLIVLGFLGKRKNNEEK